MARLDTGWHRHPRILALGLPAMALHAWSISYCDDAQTDGFIPHGAWPSLAGVGPACKALVAAGLWRVVEGGYQLHDYTDYNRTKAQVESIRAAMRANGQAGGQASARAKAQANGNQIAQQTVKQKPTPGPGPGFNSRPPAWQAGRTAHAGAREPTDFQPLGALLPNDLPDEVLERLGRPPIGDGQPALPASPSIASPETNGHAVG